MDKKPIGERLKEGVTLLKKLRDLGIGDTDPGYKEMKVRIDEWVKGEDGWTGTVDFVRWGRRAFVILPRILKREAVCNLKVWDFGMGLGIQENISS